MKTHLVLAAALFLAACSPQVYPVYLETRQPSSSGLDLARKSFSIVYMGAPADTAFSRATASALARCLEEDYFGGEEAVSLYQIPPSDTVSLQGMRTLIMDTDRDVVFLLTSRKGEALASGNVPVSSRLQIYDSLGEDKVYRYKGTALIEPREDGSTDALPEEVGRRISDRFLSQWKTESFSFYYFDTLSEDWTDALDYLYVGQFSKAIDLWMPLVGKGNALHRASAAYNIAMAFYLLDDYALAERWLEYADSLENLSLSAGLHTRLQTSRK